MNTFLELYAPSLERCAPMEGVMNKIQGPLSAVQVLAITHPATANRDRDAIIRNQEKTLGQVRGTSESWANRYLNEHSWGQELAHTWEQYVWEESRSNEE